MLKAKCESLRRAFSSNRYHAYVPSTYTAYFFDKLHLTTTLYDKRYLSNNYFKIKSIFRFTIILLR